MSTFTFVRHGQTDWNLERRIQGATDVPLNETGREQARETGRVLAERRWDGIVASPLAADAMQKDVPATDVLIALTTSRTAVIPARLAPHTLAIGVGAFKPDMVEFPAALLAERTIVVDDLGGAKHEAGDLIQAGVDWSRVRAIGDILASRGEKLQPAQGLPVFKTVGQASWDLAAARVARDSLQS